MRLVRYSPHRAFDSRMIGSVFLVLVSLLVAFPADAGVGNLDPLRPMKGARKKQSEKGAPIRFDLAFGSGELRQKSFDPWHHMGNGYYAPVVLEHSHDLLDLQLGIVARLFAMPTGSGSAVPDLSLTCSLGLDALRKDLREEPTLWMGVAPEIGGAVSIGHLFLRPFFSGGLGAIAPTVSWEAEEPDVVGYASIHLLTIYRFGVEVSAARLPVAAVLSVKWMNWTNKYDVYVDEYDLEYHEDASVRTIAVGIRTR